MTNYRIEFRKSVAKDLRSIPAVDQVKILRRIKSLFEDPRPPLCKKLSGQERYRVRQGNYRILYEIHDDILRVIVVKIGHRRDVYD